MKIYKKIIIYLLIGIMLFQSYGFIIIDNIPKAKAADTTQDASNLTEDDIDDTDAANDSSLYSDELSSLMAINTGTTQERLVGPENPRLIFNSIDMQKLRALNCLSHLAPDFNTNVNSLYNILPTAQKPASLNDLIAMQLSDPTAFQEKVRQGYIVLGINIPDLVGNLGALSGWIRDENKTYTTAELTTLKESWQKGADKTFFGLLQQAQRNWFADNTNIENILDIQIAKIKEMRTSGVAIMPDFNSDLDSLLSFLPAYVASRPSNTNELQIVKNNNATQFASYVTAAQTNWANINNYTQSAQDIASSSSNAISTVACVANLTPAQLLSPNVDLDKIKKTAVESLVIDIRVLKLLVYLVTPKDQGGAGHWRVRVRRITQLATTPYSTESEAIRTSLGTGATSNSTASASVTCDSTMTAAECGERQTEAQSADQNVTVEDANGDAYYATLETTDADGNTVDKIPERNISAHVEGKALDIIEMDDIRCTLVQKRRIGGDTKEKQPIRPIKLAWQTEQGYSDSGGNSNDIMGMLKQLAGDSVLNLINSMGGDVSDYSGDLSKANFGDVVGIMGQAIFAQIINSGNLNISGLDVEDSLQKLGTMYVADYLGLPREILLGKSFNSLEDVETLIGQGAVEKKLNLPYGSLSSYNAIKSNLPQVDANGAIVKDAEGNEVRKPVYDLQGLLINMGMRKLEHEMGLSENDLTTFIAAQSANNPSGSTAEDPNVYIGLRVIENELNLAQGSLTNPGNSFSEFKQKIGENRSKLLFADPSWMDSYVNLEAGTTKKMMTGEITPTFYVSQIGQVRMNDTLKGLTYFTANNAAFNMPTDTFPVLNANGSAAMNSNGTPKTETVWEHALKGNIDALSAIGKHYLAQAFGESIEFDPTIADQMTTLSDQQISDYKSGTEKFYTDPKNLGYAAFKDWLTQNMTATTADACALPTEAQIPQYTFTNDYQNKTADEMKTKYGITAGTLENIQIKREGIVTDAGSFNLNYTITEKAAQNLGFHHQELYSMFGCSGAGTNSAFKRIGGRILYYAIANKLLTNEEEVKIDITELDPTYRITNTTVLFYLDRLNIIKTKLEKIKTDWKDYKGADVNIANRIGEIQNSLNGANTSDFKSIMDTLAKVAHSINLLENDIQFLSSQSNESAAKLNATIADVNAITRAVDEIFQGSSSNTVSDLTLNQIQLGNNVQPIGNTSSSGTASANGVGGTALISALFSFISGNFSATQFFIFVGAGKVEDSLNLPPRSLVYLVQNYEKIGYTGADALFAAIGQARIEQQFSMPAFYFQGDELNSKMPDFDTDMAALSKYSKYKYKDSSGQEKEGNLATDSLDSFNQYALFWSHITPGISTINFSLKSYIKYLKTSKDLFFGKSTYNRIMKNAKANWQQEFTAALASRGNHVTTDTNLSNVAANVEKRKYTDSIRSGEKDIMVRMGITGDLSALKNYFTPVAQSEGNRIDNNLDIKTGSTQALITEKEVPLASGEDRLTNDELSKITSDRLLSNIAINAPTTTDASIKNQLFNREALLTYLKLINNDISLSEIGNGALPSTYAYENDYLSKPADTETSCPISYVLTETGSTIGLGNFMVNNNTIEEGSYCVYDKKGHHCFQSQSEANRYRAEHYADQYTNVLDQIAATLANLSLSFTVTADQYKTRLTSFINGQSSNVFTSSEWETLYSNYQSGNFDLFPIFEKIFSRKVNKTPLLDYKLAVGKVEAKKILSTTLFSALGINFPENIFGPEDLYNILSGNFNSLYKVASYYVDQALDMKPGTTRLIITALNPANLQCALAEAGASILGNFTGLGYVPIRGSTIPGLLQSIGEAKVEQTLGLPSGTFRGQNLIEVITRVKPINFAIKFKLPLTLERSSDGIAKTPWGSDSYVLEQIMGTGANQLKNASGQYQLQALADYLSSLPMMTDKQSAALAVLDQLIMSYAIDFLGKYGNGQVSANAANADSPTLKDNYLETKAFLEFVSGLDGIFGIVQYSTADLFAGKIAPDQYNERIGNHIAINRLAVAALGSLLGWSDEQAEAGADLALNFKSFFTCTEFTTFGTCSSTYYQNWSLFYSNLSKIIKIDLDDMTGLKAGSFEKILKNPDKAFVVLLDNVASVLDSSFNLDADKIFSFTKLYNRYAEWDNQQTEINKKADEVCLANAAAANPNYNYNNIQLQNRNYAQTVAAGQKEGATDEERAAAAQAQASINANNQQIQQFNDNVTNCEKTNRSSASFNWFGESVTIIQTGIATKIHDAIVNLKVNGQKIGVDMPLSDIKEMVFRGDLKYLEIAGMALAINWVQVGTENKVKTAVPAGMRITYNDIKQAFFPDQAVLAGAANAYAWSYVNKPNPVNPYDISIGGCPTDEGNDFLNTFVGCGNLSYATTYTDITSQSVSYSNLAYNVNITPEHPAVSASEVQQSLETERRAACNTQNQNIFTKEQCDIAENNLSTFLSGVNDAQDKARNMLKKQFEYRMLDQVLWSVDNNVFPGFTQSLMTGNSKVITSALSRYLYNGIINGHILGFQFSGIEELPQWLSTIAFIRDFTSHNQATRDGAIDTYIGSDGFKFFSDFLAKNSKNWFGVSLSSEMAGGLLVGAISGQWGSIDPMSDNVYFVTKAGKVTQTITFGSAVKNWALNQMFNWTDKFFGFDAGTTYKIFSMTKDVFKAKKALNVINKVNESIKGYSDITTMKWEDVSGTLTGKGVTKDEFLAAQKFNSDWAKMSSADKAALAKKWGFTEIDSATGKIVGKTNLSPEELGQLRQIQAQFLVAQGIILVISFVVSYFVNKWFGDAMASIESALGLVPGSLSILVDAGITVGVTAGYIAVTHTTGAFASNLMSSAMRGLWVAIAIFILINLFGVYKVEYLCSADGYYPSLESPNGAVWDVSDIGVWDGINADTMKNKTIKAAQYKARRLVADVLTAQEEPLYSDVTPSQIMTGRQEDVDFVNSLVNSNICSHIDRESVGGICGGDTLAGVWANPQTVAWTHIGF